VRPDRLVVVASGAARAALDPLLRAHRRRRPVVVVDDAAALGPLLPCAAGVLLVGRSSPARALPGPFLHRPDGTAVPAGYLPDSPSRLAVFAEAAGRVQARGPAPCGPFALLGELDERALRTAARVADVLPRDACRLHWTADRLPRAALAQALGCGVAAALYFGHASAGYWAGYGGFGGRLAAMRQEPLGAILSLACSAAARPRHGFSLAEELVLSGHCASALGAVRPTLHKHNAALGLALAAALTRAATLGGLLAACRDRDAALRPYRIIGDPLAPLRAAAGAWAAARGVFAPAPDADLPEVPLSSWTGATPPAAIAAARMAALQARE